MDVNPEVVNVTVVESEGAVLVTVPDPATVNEPDVTVAVTASLKVRTIVFSAVLSAVNVGAVTSAPWLLVTLVVPLVKDPL